MEGVPCTQPSGTPQSCPHDSDSAYLPMVCKRYTQYPWASLVAENVKNPPAMWETCVRSLGWEDIEGGTEGKIPGGGHGNPLQYSCLENPHGLF